jgi:hypothetical protein
MIVIPVPLSLVEVIPIDVMGPGFPGLKKKGHFFI